MNSSNSCGMSQGTCYKPIRQQCWPGLGIALLVVSLLAVATLTLAADSFYLGMLRRGTDAFNRRDFAEAVRLLRIACFGLLEEPELLVDGLTRLALAQLEVGDKDAFQATFERVQEVERRFGAYSKARLAPEQRAAFEAAVVRVVPLATLQADPTFARLLPSPEERLGKLPPSQRRSELERLAAQEPNEVRWPLLLAELELAEGRSGRAVKHAETALRLAPDSPQALRVHGLALAADGRCAAALAEFERLGETARDDRVQVATLRCLVELDRWEDAVRFAQAAPPELAARSDVAKLIRKAEEEAQKQAARKAKRLPSPTPGTEVAASAPEGLRTVGLAAPTEPATPTPTAPGRRRSEKSKPSPRATPLPRGGDLKPEDAAMLAEVEQLVTAGELLRAFELARQVAEANPSSPEAQRVAGEMAYRIAKWPEAVHYFRQAGGVPENEPQRQFYFAVALYETGEPAEAARELRRCLDRLQRNPFVEDYVQKILASSMAP